MWRPFVGVSQGDASPSSAAAPAWWAEWSLPRAGMRSLGQLLRTYFGVALASALVAAGCWYAGVAGPAHLALVECLALGAMLAMHVRHAADRDFIAMTPSLVRVEQRRAGRIQRIEFLPRWVRVEPEPHGGSLIRLSGRGRSVLVGAYVPRAARPQLAEELRWALRHLDD